MTTVAAGAVAAAMPPSSNANRESNPRRVRTPPTTANARNASATVITRILAPERRSFGS